MRKSGMTGLVEHKRPKSPRYMRCSRMPISYTKMSHMANVDYMQMWITYKCGLYVARDFSGGPRRGVPFHRFVHQAA